MLTFAIFPILLFFAGAFIIVGPPVALSLQDYYKNRGPQSLVCPDSGEPVEVEVDSKFAFWTALRGQQHSRLQSCTRWPGKSDCGQECLQQIDPSPENIERLLTKWYEGKSCAICTRALSPSDWRRSRLALLDRTAQAVRVARHVSGRVAAEPAADASAVLELSSGRTGPAGDSCALA